MNILVGLLFAFIVVPISVFFLYGAFYFVEKAKFIHSLGFELFPEMYETIFDRISERIKKK